jgi:hypothetical protein
MLNISTEWTRNNGPEQPGLPYGLHLSAEDCVGDNSADCTLVIDGKALESSGEYRTTFQTLVKTAVSLYFTWMLKKLFLI